MGNVLTHDYSVECLNQIKHKCLQIMLGLRIQLRGGVKP